MAAMTQYATGKRKSAIARAWVTASAGDIVVNEKPLEKAFPRTTLRNVIQFPLELAGVNGKYSVRATVHGHGARIPTVAVPILRDVVATAVAATGVARRSPTTTASNFVWTHNRTAQPLNFQFTLVTEVPTVTLVNEHAKGAELITNL